MKTLLFAACVSRILFLGNSYTYFNNLPEIVRQIARNRCTVETQMVAPGGKSLKDHWESTTSHEALNAKKWDYVVLQDQSTLGIDSYLDGNPRVTSDELFLPYAKKWADEVHRHGATPVFYLTWARRKTPADQAYLTYAYVHAAKETGSIVAPVGVAWDIVRRDHPEIDLFYDDGSHPSVTGSYLAACVLYDAIFHEKRASLQSKMVGPPVSLDSGEVDPDKTAVLVNVPAAEAAVLQSAALRAIADVQNNSSRIASLAPPPPTPALPAGEPLGNIEGTWRGKLLFYPDVGPTDVALRLWRENGSWRGHLDILYPVKDFAAESLDLTDLIVGEKGISFSDPHSAGVNNWRIDFRGERFQSQLRGIAHTVGGRSGLPAAILYGEWTLAR